MISKQQPKQIAKASSNALLNTNLTCGQRRNVEWALQLWHNERNFLERFSPANQLKLIGEERRCFLADTPSVGAVKNAWGKTFVTRWLATHLIELNEYCGVQRKMNIAQIDQCARLMTSRYGWLKPQEFMLFFVMFKSGEFGRFYGTIDPMVIADTMADFVKVRNSILDKHRNEQERHEREVRDEAARKVAITYDEYMRIKNQHRAAKDAT